MLAQNDSDKKKAAEQATEYIENGMTIGLGSGSTVYWFLKKLSEQIKQGMVVKGIPSSRRTERWAKELGIPLVSFSEVQRLDLAIDGANKIDNYLNLIKGGGGSLVREKIVNHASEQLIIIADQSKVVSILGKSILPVEVLPYGWQVTAQNIAQLGCAPKLRYCGDKIFISDNGNYILDCQFGSITEPRGLHEQLKLLVGVVETGLFPGMADKVLIGVNGNVRVLTGDSK